MRDTLDVARGVTARGLDRRGDRGLRSHRGMNYVVRGGFLETSYSGDQGFRTVMPFSGRSGFSYPLLPGVLSLLLKSSNFVQ